MTSETWDTDVEVVISALEHYSYCPRQCALIHVEQTYDENLFTIRGRLAHERVESEAATSDEGVKIVRGIPLWSEALGLRGKADVVEFRPDGPYPIEYKVGRRRGNHADVQLCAQALCLEEMFGTEVPFGALYFHAERRRYEIEIDAVLRERTMGMIAATRAILQSQRLPAAPNDARCPNCSLINACLPSAVGEPNRIRGLQGTLFKPLAVGADDA